MAELQQLTLTQLKELINANDELLANNYISRNLVVARDVKASLIMDKFVLAPTLLPEMRILFIKQGQAVMNLNMIDHHLQAGDLIYLGVNGIVQYRQASSDIQAIGFSMSDEMLQLAIGSRIPKAFDGHLRDFHLHLSQEDADYYDHLHQLLHHHTLMEGNSSQVTLHLTGALLWYVDHLWNKHEQWIQQSQSREQRLFADFIQLVNTFAPEHHTIDFYATRLCLTPRYLSTIIRQVSGKSAKQWIDDTLMTRIKIDLKHSDKPINQIADDMGFPNQSFMTKFFKRMTGITPSQYQHNET